MAPTLPASLSPHVCILQSQDLKDLFENHSLPSLPQTLQSFSPFAQVTTRTTSLTPIPLSSFALRFSDLLDIESAVHEDEEQRAERTMDWIGNRVQPRSVDWVGIVEAHNTSGKGDNSWKDHSPWWEEVKRCVESDHVPNRSEGWNHPVAIIYAISTNALNPLQALQDLHSRTIDFPPWVDASFLRYSLIVHASTSSMPDPIVESLFNAVKKQYGLQTYLLPLGLPTSPSPAPVPFPPPMLRLPPIPAADISPMPASQAPSAGLSSSSVPPSVLSSRVQSPVPSSETGSIVPKDVNTLLLCEKDIQQLGRFTREFVTMSLIPWMEKAVVDWNELYSTSRRLPSRLFSSTRRLFGSGYSSNTNTPPTTASHGSNSSVSSIGSRVNTHGPNGSVSSLASITSSGGAQGAVLVSQQRRLAEFATILGDFKLAISVWENLRKESKGGSDILPLLLAPSPALPLLAMNSIQANHAIFHDLPAQAQMRSLVNAVRWDIGIDYRDLLGNVLEGERWFVHAAGAAEEVPTALLLAHAAFLSSRKGANRRSALWYMRAADRLEKAGIKRLAMYFFRRSHQLYRSLRTSELSPSFWESEGRVQSEWRGFDAILPGIEHELGRLLYTTGDTGGAVQCFLGLLQDSKPISGIIPEGLGITLNGVSQEGISAGTDKVYLEDFRVALKHFKATESERFATSDMKLRLKFCQIGHTRIRLPGDAMNSDVDEWKSREDDWTAFRKTRGAEKLHSGGRAAVNETFWVDLAIRNPLDVDVTLSTLTIVVRETSGASPSDVVDVEVVDDIQLGARENRIIPIGIRSFRPASLVFTDVTYRFLGLLPARESLATRGRRLHDTPQQRQNKVYAPDVLLKADVEDANQRLQAVFVDNRHLLLAEGENKRMNIRLVNSGKNSITELWMLGGPEDELWVDDRKPSNPARVSSSEAETFQSSNTLAPRQPYRITLENVHSSSTLNPGEVVDIPLLLHATRPGENNLCILMTYRETSNSGFFSTRLVREYDVRPIFTFSSSSRPQQTPEHEYLIAIGIDNKTTSSSIRFTQITAMSFMWSCTPLTTNVIGTLPPSQSARATFAVDRWQGGHGVEKTRAFTLGKLRSVLNGSNVEVSDPPPIPLRCTHLSISDTAQSINSLTIRHLVQAGRRNYSIRELSTQHPYIPASLHRSVFPLYNPTSLDFVIFWEIPSQERRGHVLLPLFNLGAEHAPLTGILEEVEQTKAKRSMYAETQRERREVILGIKNSEWNTEMNPVVVSVLDGTTWQHDFSFGSFHAPMTFNLRNHSLTNPARYVLTLPSYPIEASDSSTSTRPRFIGRLTYRGELLPSQSISIYVRLSVSQPGNYVLGGWTTETEVGEIVGNSEIHWIGRQRYKQSSLDNICCISVVNESRA